MAIEIRPEPSEDERIAILEALRLEEDEAAAPSPWRSAALGARAADDELQAGALPRQSRGATRA
jgi:hypothetical protein